MAGSGSSHCDHSNAPFSSGRVRPHVRRIDGSEFDGVWEDGHPAIMAPERRSLTFGKLRALIDKTVASLNAFGVGRGDRVAIVLPNGAEMATAFVAIAAGAAAAPLNPAYRAEEFEFYMSDLGRQGVGRRGGQRQREHRGGA